MSAKDSAFAETNPVAIDMNAHKTISCIVAVAKVIFANVVCIIPKSKKIFDITGIEVMANATVITSFNDRRLFAGPIIFSKSKKEVEIQPKNKGIKVVPITNARIVFLSLLSNFLSISKPELNINSISPNQ